MNAWRRVWGPMCFGDSGAAGHAADDPGGAVPVQSPSPRSMPIASMSVPVASDTRSPLRASREISACRPGGPPRSRAQDSTDSAYGTHPISAASPPLQVTAAGVIADAAHPYLRGHHNLWRAGVSSRTDALPGAPFYGCARGIAPVRDDLLRRQPVLAAGQRGPTGSRAPLRRQPATAARA
jgi:hypothetical protein